MCVVVMGLVSGTSSKSLKVGFMRSELTILRAPMKSTRTVETTSMRGPETPAACPKNMQARPTKARCQMSKTSTSMVLVRLNTIITTSSRTTTSR